MQGLRPLPAMPFPGPFPLPCRSRPILEKPEADDTVYHFAGERVPTLSGSRGIPLHFATKAVFLGLAASRTYQRKARRTADTRLG